MKKFILIKNKVYYSADSILNKKFGKNFHPSVFTLPTIPYLIHFVNLFVVNYIEFFYKGKGIKKLIYDYDDHGDQSRWVIDYNEYKKLGKKVLTNKNFLNIVTKDFKIARDRYYREIKKLEKNGINDEGLLQNFLKLSYLYITEYAINYTVTGPMTRYGDIASAKIFKKYHNSKNIKDVFKILAKPKKDFLSQEKNDLEKIAKSVNKLKIKISTSQKLKLDALDVYNKLIIHRKKYYWISNNYKNTKYLGLDYFFKRFKKIIQDNQYNGEERTKHKINFKNIEKGDLDTLKSFGDIAQLHDERKKANMIANYWLIEYLKKISKKTGVSYSILKFASLWEIINLLEGENINFKKILERKNGCMLINTPQKEYWLTGKEYNKFKKKINKIIDKTSDKNIKGAIANHGLAKGRVSIVINVKKDGKKLKNGDILVASMTRPEFMPLVNRVKAIITDEGGITSHAAVISRELNIPCIVGTGNATKVLKDGDMVEVDADKGVVKIFMKNKNNY